MKEGLRSAVKNASAIGTAVTLLFAICGSRTQSAAASEHLSCVSALEKGKDLLGQRLFRQAEELLVSASRGCPDVAEIFDTLGLAHDFDGHPSEAQAAYRKAISINPRNAAFHNNLAASLLRSGNQAAGINEFQKALGIDPANNTANLNLGSLYLVTKQYESALRCLRAAQVAQSQDARAARDTAGRLAKIPSLQPAVHFSLGLELAAHGEYELAAQQFAAIPAPDRDVAAELNLGMAYSKLRRFQEAREAYDDALRRDPSSPDAFLRIGLDAATLGDNASALDWIAQAHTKSPDRPDISYALAKQLIRVGNFDRARPLLASALADHPDEPGLREAQGDLSLQEGRPQEAVKAYLQTLRAEPGRVSARVSLAAAYERLGQSDKATSELKQVLRVDPQNAAAKARLGHMALDAGQHDAASKWIQEALASDPNDLTANEDMAVLLERAGKPDQAQMVLEKLAKLEPTNPQIHYLLSRVLAQLRKPEEAKAEFELSKKLQTRHDRHSD
jgi:Flp pilus assembly protein TadD